MDADRDVGVAVGSMPVLHQGRDREVRGEQSLLFEPFDHFDHPRLVEHVEARIWPLIKVRGEHQELVLEITAYLFDPHREELIQQFGSVAHAPFHLV